MNLSPKFKDAAMYCGVAVVILSKVFDQSTFEWKYEIKTSSGVEWVSENQLNPF
jgi:hypothetical protein